MNIACWIIPLICLAIGALLGWLLAKAFLKSQFDNSEELDSWKRKYSKLEKDLSECKGQLSAGTSNASDVDMWKRKSSALESDLAACRGQLASAKAAAEAPPVAPVVSSIAASAPAPVAASFDAAAAKLVFGKRIKQDDLKIVEGIGPKIEELFHNFDIKTWQALAEASIEKCQEVLNSGGERYKIHNPGTWPRQAALAAKGKWEELLKWQDELDGGKE